MKRLFATPDSATLLVQRLVLGAVMFPHGMQKLLGWYGGGGWNGTIASFTGTGIPFVLAVLAILAESLGSLGLIAGFLTRVAAAGIATNMLVAIFRVHAKVGFFMNWTGRAAGEGFEYHLLALALALPLIVLGGGRWSIDRWIARHRTPYAEHGPGEIRHAA